MNTNEISPNENNFRLNRIKRVSKYFRLFTQYGLPMMFLGAIFYHLIGGPHHAKLDLSQVDKGVFLLKSMFFLLWGIFSLVVIVVCYWKSVKLFGFFEQGFLFTTETARCLKAIGFTNLLGILCVLGMYLCDPFPNKTWPHTDPIFDIYTAVFYGTFLIFLGWLFDEAQKMREEQELTV